MRELLHSGEQQKAIIASRKCVNHSDATQLCPKRDRQYTFGF